MSKHEAMFNYMKQYSGVDKLFSFNFSEVRKNASAFKLIGEETRSKDIFDNETIVYIFAIAEYRNYSTEPFTSENLEHIEAVDDFIEWVREQDRNENYPDFGTGTLVSEIQAMRTGSGIVDIDPNGRVAQYSFTVKVTYTRNN